MTKMWNKCGFGQLAMWTNHSMTIARLLGLTSPFKTCCARYIPAVTHVHMHVLFTECTADCGGGMIERGKSRVLGRANVVGLTGWNECGVIRWGE